MTPPDLNDVRIFVVVARVGTFTAAARELQLPPSTVARAMTRLEQSFEVLLLRRNPRGISLTDPGKEFLGGCKRALRTLKLARETLRERRASPSGLIKVASPVTTARSVLVPVLPEFLKRYPDLRVDLEIYATDWDREPKEDIDVFFRVGHSKDSSRRVRNFPSTARGLFASHDYLKRAGMPASPEALLSHCCIGIEAWKLIKQDKTIAVDPVFRVVAADPVIYQELVLADVGIALLPLVMAKQPEIRGRIEPVLPEWVPDPLTHSALFFGPSRLTPKVQVFLDFIGEFFGTDRDPRLGKVPVEGLFPRVT